MIFARKSMKVIICALVRNVIRNIQYVILVMIIMSALERLKNEVVMEI